MAAKKAGASMVLKTVFTEGVAHMSYLIGDKATGQAAVIDPRRDVDVYLEMAAQYGLSITYILETHIHADFVSGTRELAARVGGAKVRLSNEGGAHYDFPTEPLKDGDTIDLGRVVLTARHTPGHTPEHMSYLAAESNRLDQHFAVFSGDCLFADSVGRPDLLGDDATHGLAQQLYTSLYDFYLKLPDAVLVYPAHGAGSPCGADISDRLVTSIGYERRNNAALQFDDPAKFIEHVLFTAPPEPVYYPRMKKENAAGPALLGSLPACPALPPKAFQAQVAAAGTQLLDNRQMLAFGGGHIAGALNIGPRAELSIWAGWMFDPKKPLFLILHKDEDLPTVLTQLLRVGFTEFGGYLAGGMEAWDNAALPLLHVPQITVGDVHDSPPQGLQIVDVRSPGEWQGGHVPGATYLFLPEIPQKQDHLHHYAPIAVYCDSGYRASLAASELQLLGFPDVRTVVGSWKAWKAAGYPIDKPQEQQKASDTDMT